MDISILLPFLVMAAGYSVSECLPLKYRMAMVSGYLQYGAIILYGLLYLIVWTWVFYLALMLLRAFGFVTTIADFGVFVMESAPLVSVSGVLSSFAISYLFNTRYRDGARKEDLASKISVEYGDELDVLLFDAKRRSAPLLLVLDNQMLYLGWVVGTPNPLDDKEYQYIRILPIKSGYRNEQREVVFTTHYDTVVESMGEDYVNVEDFEKVIPRKSITSANIFHIGIYQKYFKKK